MFRIIWIIAVVVVALGWIAYGIWVLIERRRERNMPKQPTKKKQEVRKSFEDYATKLKEFEKAANKKRNQKNIGKNT